MAKAHSSTRHQSKEHTRQALVRAALKLLSHNSFDSLSLREVTREAGITPTAFYRHFDDMEELGLDLVEESFRSFGAMLRDAQAHMETGDGAIRRFLDVVVDHLHEQTAHFRFIVRERNGGVRRLRRAVNRELQLFADELAITLAPLPEVAQWSTDDRRMLAGLIMATTLDMVAELLEVPPEEEPDIVERTTHQLRLVGLGASAWGGAPADAAND
jgi:TetR/AcrR family transcriptional regulator, fatty acid biosynthesis regulator